jgi:L-histidine Nalpha-methyltransferase
MTAFRTPAVLGSPIAEDVLQGLSENPKRLPAKLFYDAEGSRLFEEITQTAEYYPTRTEFSILKEYAGEIATNAGANLTLVELGAGSATKTRALIEAILRRQLRLEFHPVDVSPAALQDAVTSLNGDYTHLHVSPIVADYTANFPPLKSLPGRKLVLFIGSTIGNFEPGEAAQFLRDIRKSLEPGDAFLLGIDLVKAPRILRDAYNDKQLVTERFNKNVLSRINRELGADFDVRMFKHIAFWNPGASRIEMHLESRVAQTVNVRDLNRSFHFNRGERIHTENSYKFTPASITKLLSESGFKLEKSWTDPKEWFCVLLARA